MCKLDEDCEFRTMTLAELKVSKFGNVHNLNNIKGQDSEREGNHI